MLGRGCEESLLCKVCQYEVMRYFKRPWDEDRGDEYASWGTSIWYFEVNDQWEVLRQLEVYESGTILAYDASHLEDRYGMLADQELPPEEMPPFEITKAEFEQAWNSARPLNRTEPPPPDGLKLN
jgi:hypothetical protein